jgi:hypothetical protein
LGPGLLVMQSVIVKMVILICIKIQKWKNAEMGDVSKIDPGVSFVCFLILAFLIG